MQTTQFFEMYRASVRTATEVMQQSLESAERVQRQQLDLLRGAVEENVRSSRELADAKSFDELVSAQQRYGRAQLDRTIDFWSKMWRSASEAQAASVRELQGKHERKSA